MGTSSDVHAEFKTRAKEASPTLERELLAQVAELRQLTNELKRQLSARLRPGPRPLATRMVVLKDRVALAKASLQAAQQEAETLAPPAAVAAAEPSPPKSALKRAALMVAPQRWTPSETELQRGRAALLEEFEQPHNLTAARFAQLAGKSRQQVYKDLQASPPRLLALSAGTRGKRLPEWQLDERGRLLTQQVMGAAPTADAWTVYHALHQPAGALGGRSPAQAALKGTASVDKIANIVLQLLGVHPSDVQS